MATEIEPTAKMKATLEKFLAWQGVKVVEVKWVQRTDKSKSKCAVVRFEGEGKNGRVSDVMEYKLACWCGCDPYGNDSVLTPFGHITARLSRDLYCVMAFTQPFDARHPEVRELRSNPYRPRP